MLEMHSQIAAGFFFGIVMGLAMGVVRPLLWAAVAGAALFVLFILLTSGVAAVVLLFERVSEQLLAFAGFFGAWSAGEVLGFALATRR
jgi:hypothetical protein